MKTILTPALLATMVVVAGCGGATKTGSGPLTITGTTTLSNMKVGTTIRCKGGPGASVPAAGHGVAGIADPVPGASGGEIQLTSRKHGSVVAVCRRN